MFNIVLLKTKLQLKLNTKMIQIYGCNTYSISYIIQIQNNKQTKHQVNFHAI